MSSYINRMPPKMVKIRLEIAAALMKTNNITQVAAITNHIRNRISKAYSQRKLWYLVEFRKNLKQK